VAVVARHKAPAAMAAVVAMDVVANTHPAHKVHGVPKATAAVAVKAVVHVLPWVTHNRAATKADLAAVWVNALPAPQPAVNPTPCAPVSI
jgi:hypothetical protein